MTNGKWMNGLQRMNTPDLIDQFASLWDSLQQVQLSDSNDTISWTKKPGSSYSASTAYAASFQNVMAKFHRDIRSILLTVIPYHNPGTCSTCLNSTTTMNMGIEPVLKKRFRDAIKDTRQSFDGDQPTAETTPEVDFRTA